MEQAQQMVQKYQHLDAGWLRLTLRGLLVKFLFFLKIPNKSRKPPCGFLGCVWQTWLGNRRNSKERRRRETRSVLNVPRLWLHLTGIRVDIPPSLAPLSLPLCVDRAGSVCRDSFCTFNVQGVIKSTQTVCAEMTAFAREVHFVNGVHALWVCIKDLVKCDQVAFCYFARVRL